MEMWVSIMETSEGRQMGLMDWRGVGYDKMTTRGEKVGLETEVDASME